nr:hypothetical protein CFP56_17083 [Quercus suber]
MIVGFTIISNRFKTSKHVIKAQDYCLALVDVVIKGFIGKPPLEGTQVVELPTFENPQPVIEEITSLGKEAETKSEDHTLKGDTEIPVRDKDFEIFYYTNAFEEERLNSQLTITLVSEDQKGTKVPEGMVIEKKLLDLLSLLESYARIEAPKVPVVPRPPTLIPPAQEDASIHNFDGRRASYMANVVEQDFLLPKDMDELRNLKKHELFLSVKRDLALLVHLREVESQLSIAWITITDLKKELSQKDKEMEEVEQTSYDQGQKETEAHLKSQLPVVCRNFYLQAWIEALNAARVDSNFELRNLENAFYPATIRARPVDQPPVSTSASTPVGSTENPLPKSSTVAPVPAKPIEQ